MSLFLDSNDCNSAIVIYDDINVIMHHDPQTQSLSLPTIPVLKRHLSSVLSEKQDNIVRSISSNVINVNLNPTLGAFAYAALEYVTERNYKIRSIRHVSNSDSEYLFKSGMFSCITEIFIINVSNHNIIEESLVTINVDKVFRKGPDIYYNGMVIDTLSAIVLIEQLFIRFDL